MRRCKCGNTAPMDNELCNACQPTPDPEHEFLVYQIRSMRGNSRTYVEDQIIDLLEDIVKYIKRG